MRGTTAGSVQGSIVDGFELMLWLVVAICFAVLYGAHRGLMHFKTAFRLAIAVTITVPLTMPVFLGIAEAGEFLRWTAIFLAVWVGCVCVVLVSAKLGSLVSGQSLTALFEREDAAAAERREEWRRKRRSGART